MMDAYEILGLPKGASENQIRDAYRKKSKKHHPDAGGDDWAFIQVEKAYRELINRAVNDPVSSENSEQPTAASESDFNFNSNSSANFNSTDRQNPVDEKNTTGKNRQETGANEPQSDLGAANLFADIFGAAIIGCFLSATIGMMFRLGPIECGILGAVFGGISGLVNSRKSSGNQANKQKWR